MIHKFRVDKGLSVSELAKKAKCSTNEISALANGSISPIYEKKADKGIKDNVIRICTVLDCTPEDVFPRYFCAINRHKGDDLPPYEQISERLAISSEDIFSEKELVSFLIDRANLSHKSKKYLFYRFVENMTLDEIGAIFKVTREYVRQKIEKILAAIRLNVKYI